VLGHTRRACLALLSQCGARQRAAPSIPLRGNRREPCIEAKLDQLSVQVAVQPYMTAMRSGGTLLGQAQRGWRSPRDRQRLLHEARMQYVQAAAGAPDQATAVDAEVYLAMTWLLLGSLEDTRAILADAALTLEQIVDGIVDPILAWRNSPDDSMRSVVGHIFDSTRSSTDPLDQPELRVRMEQPRDLQDMRRLLGMPPADSSKPSRRLGQAIVWDPPRRGSSRHA
jgi:hypothetical protein